MFKSKYKKNIKKICKNCQLFDPNNSECSIIILWEGEKRRLPVDEDDNCFYEEEFTLPDSDQPVSFIEHVQEVKIWVEDENGNKTSGNGKVKIEYPEGFFGDKKTDH